MFWSLLALVAVYLDLSIGASRGLAHDIERIRQRGEPVHYGDGFPTPQTPEQREASQLYAQAVALAQEQDAEENHRVARLDLDKPGGTELSLPDIVAAYRADAPPLQVLDRATSLDFVGFAPEDRQPSAYELPLVTLGSFACLRADISAVHGVADAAVAAPVPAIRLERHSGPVHAARNRPTGSWAVSAFSSSTSADDDSLVPLQRAFGSWRDDDDVLQNLLQQRAQFIDMSEGDPRDAAPWIARVPFRPFLIRSIRRVLRDFDAVIESARQPWPARWQAAADLQRRYPGRPPRGPGSTARLFDPFGGVYPAMGLTPSARVLAVRRVAIAVLAVERYRRSHAGALPTSLDTLVPALLSAVPQDPFSELPLAYRPAADGYAIYSVDVNCRDDGGAFYGHRAAVTKFVAAGAPRISASACRSRRSADHVRLLRTGSDAQARSTS